MAGKNKKKLLKKKNKEELPRRPGTLPNGDRYLFLPYTYLQNCEISCLNTEQHNELLFNSDTNLHIALCRMLHFTPDKEFFHNIYYPKSLSSKIWVCTESRWEVKHISNVIDEILEGQRKAFKDFIKEVGSQLCFKHRNNINMYMELTDPANKSEDTRLEIRYLHLHIKNVFVKYAHITEPIFNETKNNVRSPLKVCSELESSEEIQTKNESMSISSDSDKNTKKKNNKEYVLDFSSSDSDEVVKKKKHNNVLKNKKKLEYV